MKIVILNGSPRKNGSTAYILHHMEKVLLEQGAEVIYYDLCAQNIALCTGCCACYKLGHCVIDDDAEKISAQIEASDGIIIGSSTIASNVPGLLKVFIDRGHFVIEQLLNKKYAFCITTYENYGGHAALKVLKSLVTLSGAILSGAFHVKIPFNHDISSDTALSKKTKKYALMLFHDIVQQKKHLFQRLKQQSVVKIGLKPFILRKGKEYAGVQKRWSDIGLLP